MAISPRNSGNRGLARIVIVDDHTFMRDLMVRTLSRRKSHYAILAAVGTAAEAITACAKLKPDVLVLDINLPDRSGIDALPDIRRVTPATRVLLCTGFPTDDRVMDLARTGARGFVEKTNTWDEFLSALERVNRGEYYFSSRNLGLIARSRTAQKNDSSFETAYLTLREKQIAALIAGGFINKEIAAKLHISIQTVATHRRSLMSKLRVRNAAGIIDYAFRSGMIKPGPRYTRE